MRIDDVLKIINLNQNQDGWSIMNFYLDKTTSILKFYKTFILNLH
jgi:hypothetical protein